MYIDIEFSSTSEIKLESGKKLWPGTYKLVNRANQLLIWDIRNIAVASIPNQMEFDELVLKKSIKIQRTINAATYTVEKDQVYRVARATDGIFKKNMIINIIEYDTDNYFIFEEKLLFKITFVHEMIENGTFVLIPKN